MITIKTASLKAACEIAAKKDIRYYLNGVQILVRDDGDVHVRATDGHCVFDDLMPEKSVLTGEIIIPLSSAKLIAKSTLTTVTIELLADGRYECAGHLFTKIDGKFPEVDRIMPKRDKSYDNAPGNQYDPELLVRCHVAMRIATGKKLAWFRVQNSPTGLMFRETNQYPRCAIMPLRPIKAFIGN